MKKTIITGSEGTIGKSITPFLKSKGYEIIPLDIRATPSFNLLTDNLTPFLKGAKYFIHLAANPDPRIKEKDARKNFDMTQRIIEQLETPNSLELIINASSS